MKAIIPQVEVLNLVPKPCIMSIRSRMEESIAPMLLPELCKMPEALSRASPRPRNVPNRPRISSIPGITEAIFSAFVATDWLSSAAEPISAQIPGCVACNPFRSQACCQQVSFALRLTFNPV
ncbi:hypothetical protein D3C76_1322520 [compost metagenome]